MGIVLFDSMAQAMLNGYSYYDRYDSQRVIVRKLHNGQFALAHAKG